MFVHIRMLALSAILLLVSAPDIVKAQTSPGHIEVCVVDHKTKQPCEEPNVQNMADVKIGVARADTGQPTELGKSCESQGRCDVIGASPSVTYVISARATRGNVHYASAPVTAEARQSSVPTNPRPILLIRYVKQKKAARTTFVPDITPQNDSPLEVNLIKAAASQAGLPETQGGGAGRISITSIAETDALIGTQSRRSDKENCITVASGTRKISGAKVIAYYMDKDELAAITGDEGKPYTDAHGQYCVNTALEGTYLLTILADNYQPKNLLISIEGKELFLYKPEDEPDQSQDVELIVETEADRLRRTIESTPSASEYTRQRVFNDPLIQALPLSGIRTLDSLAALVPGVAPPPETIGGLGPGVSSGVGAAGQFSINGLRSRENNFTIDGSDNNDEDIGVRRQGFVILTPQSVENTAEVQVVTALGDSRFGRNIGGQINVISMRGRRGLHASVYGFFTHNRFNARDFFNSTASTGPSGSALIRAIDNAPVLLDGRPLVTQNQAGGENPFRRVQVGIAGGGRLPGTNTFFFSSFEKQDIRSRRESHFIVPTVSQRAVFDRGETGFIENHRVLGSVPLFPATIPGNAIFSLYPFPNNPQGPYGKNTYTTVLPANGRGMLFSARLDRQFHGEGKPPEGSALRNFFTNYKSYGDQLTGRYNLTDELSTLPVTGGALFSSLRPRVRTQNTALLFHRTLSRHTTDLIRLSFGRTRLFFGEARDLALLPSSFLPDTRFLLNAPLLLNVTRPNLNGSLNSPRYVSASSSAGTSLLNSLGYSSITQTEQITGPLGQVIIPGFSPIGVDVYNFPQTRANNTFQIADTITRVRGGHIYTFGFDIRKTQINSTLDRNFRPLAIFNGLRSSSASPTLQVVAPDGIPLPTTVFSGTTLAAAGVPTGFFQTFATVPDSSIGLRFTQVNAFAQGEWRVRSNLRITTGLRYEVNTVPDTVGKRLEKAFDPEELRRQATQAANFCNDPIRCSDLVSRLTTAFPADFKVSFGTDRNDFDVRLGFVWDPLKEGRTVVRGGFGTYSGQFPGIVIDQSRNAFSAFLPLNYANFSPRSNNDNRTFLFNLANPYVQQLDPSLSILTPGTLNTFPSINPVALLSNRLISQQGLGLAPTILGLDLVLPQRELKNPYSMQSALTIEQQFLEDYIVSLAYVWTRGVKLLRMSTPDLGLNNSRFDESLATLRVVPLDGSAPFPFFEGRLSPSQRSIISQSFGIARTFFESSSTSSYHSLQFEVQKRYSSYVQFRSAFTYAHAIDDASDFFDTAGAFALPQDSLQRSEKASSNFDIRLRSATYFIVAIPSHLRLFKYDGWLGGWQVAGLITAQTGQPYTVNSAFDINRDGNLTDRLNSADGIIRSDGRVQLRLAPGVDPLALLAPDGFNGAVGRNTFRAPSMFTVDLALTRDFSFGNYGRFQFRTEIFNLFNRANYGIPVRILESPAFGSSISTIVPARTVQFSGKYRF
ncbi:MAG TPA: Plug domain-containing protein [Nitrososphaera sp.]|nr:Plug domain-containing protein [Nitrososphaera sp.]